MHPESQRITPPYAAIVQGELRQGPAPQKQVTILQLGRYGDIVNLLPVAKQLADNGALVHWIVSNRFKDALSGVSYVTPIVFPKNPEDLPAAIKWSSKVSRGPLLVTQVACNPEKWGPTLNYQQENWERAGCWDGRSLPLVFDRRNADREKALWESLNVPPGKPVCLLSLCGKSSPFRERELVAKTARDIPGFHVVDISDLRAESVIDLAGIIDRSSALVSVDTLTLHLAYATKTPVVALTNDKPWLATTPRPNWVLSLPYNQAVTADGLGAIGKAIASCGPSPAAHHYNTSPRGRQGLPRIAFTIILNGLHHLLHNSYAETLCDMVDHWVIVEGAAGNTGSTAWCKAMPPEVHKDGRSVDGTVKFLQQLADRRPNVHVVIGDGLWPSKDAQVNRAVDEVRKLASDCWLWEIDADEQWAQPAMDLAETTLAASGNGAAAFRCDAFMGKDIVARGEWGENPPYRRLWRWNGESFDTHEPPRLHGCGKNPLVLPQRFSHYSYYFEQDVKFKSQWYGGHEAVYENWLKLQRQTKFPRPISALFGMTSYGLSKTSIVKR
jgi:hypothetical protein